MLARIIVEIYKYFSSGASKHSTNQHIVTKVPVDCLYMVQLSKLKLLQKANKSLYTSRYRIVIESGCPNITKLIITSSDASPRCLHFDDVTYPSHSSFCEGRQNR